MNGGSKAKKKRQRKRKNQQEIRTIRVERLKPQRLKGNILEKEENWAGIRKVVSSEKNCDSEMRIRRAAKLC